jgi:hypothetical protein
LLKKDSTDTNHPSISNKKTSRSRERKEDKAEWFQGVNTLIKPKSVNNVFDNESEELIMVSNKVIKSK